MYLIIYVDKIYPTSLDSLYPKTKIDILKQLHENSPYKKLIDDINSQSVIIDRSYKNKNQIKDELKRLIFLKN